MLSVVGEYVIEHTKYIYDSHAGISRRYFREVLQEEMWNSMEFDIRDFRDSYPKAVKSIIQITVKEVK